MKKRKGLSILFCLLAVILLFTPAYAELIDNLDGTVTQIRNDGSILMWLKDANTAETQTFGVEGILSGGDMNWYTANDWIAAMNNANYLGYNDWRLPAVNPINGSTFDYTFSYNGSTDNGYNIISPNHEMSYMFYVELGNLGRYDTEGNYRSSYGISNWGLFVNFDGAYGAWSGGEIPLYPERAWHIDYTNGYEDILYNKQTEHSFAWAVRTVPEPISSVLFITGGAILAGRRYLIKKKKKHLREVPLS